MKRTNRWAKHPAPAATLATIDLWVKNDAAIRLPLRAHTFACGFAQRGGMCDCGAK